MSSGKKKAIYKSNLSTFRNSWLRSTFYPWWKPLAISNNWITWTFLRQIPLNEPHFFVAGTRFMLCSLFRAIYLCTLYEVHFYIALNDDPFYVPGISYALITMIYAMPWSNKSTPSPPNSPPLPWQFRSTSAPPSTQPLPSRPPWSTRSTPSQPSWPWRYSWQGWYCW